MSTHTVIVTGGAAGIGRATVERFFAAGANVAVWDVDAARGAAFVAELDPAGTRATFQTVDVTNTGSVTDAIAAVVATFGRIDVLINNAGITRDATLVKWKDGALVGQMDDAAFDAVVSVNQRGVFVCTRGVVPQMIQQGGGVILNATSVVGLYGNFGQTNYAGTKFAVIGMTKTWSRELGKYGIRVNAVAPGFIATELVAKMPEKVIAGMVQHTPLGRMGQPVDIANAYYWLASSDASFVTGAVFSIDGGIVLGT
jgi:3-oxoacyl-[acyl-carrier protein] reductase